MNKEAMYEGKLAMIIYGHDVSSEETDAEVNRVLGREWDWDLVWDWYYGDGDPGFGVNPRVGADDPRVLRVRDEFAVLLENGNPDARARDIEDERVMVMYENDDTVVFFVNE